MKKVFTKFVSMLLSAVFVISILSIPSFAGQKVIWQETISGVYDTNVPGTILPYKDELMTGGMDLYTGKMTTDKASADISYYSRTIGARDIIDLGETDFDKVDTIPDKGFSYELTASSGHVYIVSTHKGEFAKVKIKSILASSVNIEYAIFKENVPATTSTDTTNQNSSDAGGSTNTGNGGGSSIDLGLGNFSDIALSANIEEGNLVSVTWKSSTNNSDESYDIYRSDNGAKYIKLNDLRLGDQQYEDEDCKVGHYYLYRIIAYDGEDNLVKVYPLMRAVIVKKQTTAISLLLDSVKVKINGKDKTMDSSPVLINKKVMIPASYFSPLFGAKVVWSAKNGTATITYNKINAVLKLNSSTAAVNNKKVVLDAPLQMYKNKLMIPASLLSNVLNMKVKYTASTKTIAVTINNAADSPASSPNNTDTATGSKNATGLDYAYKTFILWVPGGSYVVTDYNSGTNTLYTSAGTLPKSTLSVNKDGTYIWNSDWDGKIIKGKWTSNGDGTLNLLNGQEGKTWKLEQSNGKNEDIYILDGYTWYSGKAVNVKNK